MQVERDVPITWGAWFKDKGRKAWEITKIALVAIAMCALFLSNPTMFAIGFLAGIIWDKFVDQQVEKVKTIAEQNGLLVATGLGVGAFLSLQVIVGGVLAVGCGAWCGSMLSLRSQAKAEGEIAQRQLAGAPG